MSEKEVTMERNSILNAVDVFDGFFSNKDFQKREFQSLWEEWFDWFQERKKDFLEGRINENTFYNQLKRLNDFFKTKTNVQVSSLPIFIEKKIQASQDIQIEEPAKIGLTF